MPVLMPHPAPPPENQLALLRGVSRSFYLSIRLLPARLRAPVAVAYLLARATDTVADTADLPPTERGDQLTALAAAIDGSSADPAGVLARLAADFAPRQHDPAERRLILALPACLDGLARLAAADQADVRAVLRTITRGQQLDVARFGAATATHPAALRTRAELTEYTWLVAGCVGEFWTALCARHLPDFATLPTERLQALGRRYGMALQLINILRDAGDDLAAGRCYLPADELDALGLAPDELLRAPGPRLAPLLAALLAEARAGLDDGLAYALAVNARRVRAASALPALIGARTLALLEAAGPGALQRRVKVPRAEVRNLLLRLALSAAARGPLQRARRALRT